MSYWDLIALVTGILGVLLTIKQTIWCWPFALISVIISISVFYTQRLYGDMCLNIFYFASGVYGWVYWNTKKNDIFIVSKLPTKFIVPLVVVTGIQFIIYYYLLVFFKSDLSLVDALLTAISLTATYMMTKKWLENWMVWIVVDFAYVFLYLKKDMAVYAVLYGFFTLMAAYGFFSWKQQLKKTL